ncbi:hypothetical protein [Okeania sp. SIO2B3]|uniref:hypothetical protein n=1 Tax=Okeania sp. SIO2B3 TaxID=2607784 RepID=UPI0013BEF76B|nr:hypothetical protein [Okeania sp. SIO2B3]NET45473.1 hypothetical protein [Okeania sp. SIO2B3]
MSGLDDKKAKNLSEVVNEISIFLALALDCMMVYTTAKSKGQLLLKVIFKLQIPIISLFLEANTLNFSGMND